LAIRDNEIFGWNAAIRMIHTDDMLGSGIHFDDNIRQ